MGPSSNISDLNCYTSKYYIINSFYQKYLASHTKMLDGYQMFTVTSTSLKRYVYCRSGSSRYTVIDYAAREHLMARDLDQREIAANNVTPQNSAETCFVLVLLENHNKQNYEYLLTCENE